MHSLEMESGHTRSIAVIGSLNVDLVTRTGRIPDGGETLTSRSFDIGFGGKGANQAVACARLSRTKSQAENQESGDVKVHMVGAVGNDSFADDFLASLSKDGLDMSQVSVISGKKTGTAVIIVEEDTGENRILLSPGANHSIPSSGLLPPQTDVAVFQLEIPKEIVFDHIQTAKQKGIAVIFNPAPAIPLPQEIFQGLDHLIVNESEGAILSGNPQEQITPDSDLSAIAGDFIDSGVLNVIITLGSHGVFHQTVGQHKQKKSGTIIPAQKVKVVDTTAAGDTFVGAYAVAVARSRESQGNEFDISAAVKFANGAASLTVQRAGAQSAIPWLDELQEIS